MNKQELKQAIIKTWLVLLKLSHTCYYKSFQDSQCNENKDEDIILSIANTKYETHRLALEANYTILMYN